MCDSPTCIKQVADRLSRGEGSKDDQKKASQFIKQYEETHDALFSLVEAGGGVLALEIRQGEGEPVFGGKSFPNKTMAQLFVHWN